MIISIEGADGYGKTLYSNMLADYTGFTYLKFPNESLESGKEVRAMINGKIPFDRFRYQFLQNKNKRDTLEELSDKNYIFDRYKLSEIIYGKVNEIPEAVIYELVDKLPDPDITILIVGKPYRQDSDLFSSMGYQRKVKELYFEESKKADGRVIRVCNYGSIEEVFERILNELKGVIDAS